MKAKVIATGEIIYDVEEYLFDVGRFQVHGRTKEGQSVFFRAEEVTLLPKDFQEKDIDWEQRRYEIASKMAAAFVSDTDNMGPISHIKGNPQVITAKIVMELTDALIEELKKHGNKNEV